MEGVQPYHDRCERDDAQRQSGPRADECVHPGGGTPMRRHQRRGAFLTEIVALLPIVASLVLVSTRVIVGIIRFEGRVNQQMIQQSKMSDLARRLELDAAHAQTARLDSDSTVQTLAFPTAQYIVRPDRVTRVEQTPGGQPIACS